MEKLSHHYDLGQIKRAMLERGAASFTATAMQGVADMGLSQEEAIAVVLSLTRAMFHKSMTTYANSQVWQDVYRSPCPNGKTAYIKVTLRNGSIVIQFKEL